MATDEQVTPITVLGNSECWSLLRTAEVGRLAVVVDGAPDIFPVNYRVDHGSIVFRTAQGTKLAGALSGHPVAFEVDGHETGPSGADEAWSVVAKGSAHEVKRMDDLLDAMGLELFPWHTAPHQQFVRITPDQVTGRRFPVDPPGEHAPLPEGGHPGPE